ncbi:hypothetical protein GmHk_20G057001 [Glycine max]|nr:hypothetical protein GmHk_20G057001 [Glycine max]
MWLKDSMTCLVTFSVMDSSSWSLICWVSCCNSSGGREEALRDIRGADLKFDTAQTLVSRFLQVFSFFEDEGESPVESDETKVQTWSSQHYRNEPVVVVAAPRLQKYSTFDDQSGEKPLLLPIRSLKSRLSEEDIDVQSLNMSMSSKRFSSYSNRKAEVKAVDADDVDAEVQSQKRSTSSKRFSSNSNRNTKVEGSRAENKKKESVVLPSPIPWRSRSGRLEHKQEEFDEASNMMFPSSKEESHPVKSQPSCASSRDNSVLMDKFDGLQTFVGDKFDAMELQVDMRFDAMESRITRDQDVEGGRTVAQNNDSGKGPPIIGGESSKTDGDEGPDVDKKVDEFIAKFIEQIRLQRIKSIKRSTRSARNSSRFRWEDYIRQIFQNKSSAACSNIKLSAKYTRLYKISNQQHQIISSVGSQKDAGWEWSFSWRRSLCENEIGMAAEFLQELAQVKIQQNRPDLWVSKAHPSGNYSTKSTYRLRIACQLGQT